MMELTYNRKIDKVPDGWCGGNLALVDTGILTLGISYPQGPLLGVRRVHGFEALIRGVRVPTDC